MVGDKIMNHVEYPKKLKKKSDQELNGIINDCKDSINVYPGNPNNGYYFDEIAYCSMELQIRKKVI